MKLKSIITSICLLTLSQTASAGLLNSGFEDGNLNGWSTSGNVIATQSINNFAGVGSVNTVEGSYMAQLSAGTTSAASIASIMGVSEATLEASNAGVNATDGSIISQSTTAIAGDSFTFNWNFVEQDYVPYDDWAFYGVQYENQATEIFKFASLATTGPSSGSTINGWETLTVDTALAGNYTFYFGVVNALDTALDSTLFIDGITFASEVPEPSSIALFGLGALGLIRLRKKA